MQIKISKKKAEIIRKNGVLITETVMNSIEISGTIKRTDQELEVACERFFGKGWSKLPSVFTRVLHFIPKI